MSDHTQLIARAAARNPVPNPEDPPFGAWDVDIVRAQVTERDRNMLTDERPNTMNARPVAERRRGPLVAFATFAIILLAAGGLWLANRSSAPGEVAGQPPTTNVPANEREQVALDAMVAYFTFNEEELLAMENTSSEDVTAFVTRELRFDRALNTRTESVTCTADGAANAAVNCQFVVKSDLFDAIGIADHLMEANVSVLNGGWTDIFFERNIEDEPVYESFIRDTNSGMFAPGQPCFWNLDQGVLDTDWDACAAVWIPFAENWFAETGKDIAP